MCLLRARGLNADADLLQDREFAAARLAAEAQESESSAAGAPERFQALLEAEESRVADALLFAEVLAPLIAEQIRPSTSPASAAQVTSRSPAAPSPTRAPVSRPRDEPAPSIADLIDGMLGQERSAHSPSH